MIVPIFNMRKIVFFLTVLLINFCSSNKLQAQTPNKAEQEEKAYNALNDNDYILAYSLFDKLNSQYPKEFDYQFKLGLCCLNYPEKKARAIEIFQDIKKESKGTEIDYYLGKAYHINYKFDEAIAILQPLADALTKSGKKQDKKLLEDTKLIILNCNNGKFITANKIICEIQNLGAPVNTEEDQYVPAITTDESVLFFTYRGKKSTGGKVNTNLEPDLLNGIYTEDVYFALNNTDGTFSEPMQLPGINTKGSDAAIAVSPDGQNLFIFYSDAKNYGDILMSTLEGTKFSKPVPLNKNINTVDYWEGSCSISADGKYLYFASERPGGLGGRDIWVSEKVDGDWGPAKNLGSKINTKYNDDAPFIHPDGITLFFSSEGHSSIGGYDIMFSVKKDNDWIEPKSMGVPLNTTEDDRFYVINDEGTKGYFSSNRSGGLGKEDIYVVNPGILGEKPVIALLKGVVYGDDKPIEATIEVLKVAQKENIGPFLSNNITGKYLMALSPGYIYRVKVLAKGFEPLEEDFDVESLNKFVEKNKDFYLYSPNKVTNVDTVKKVTVLTPTVEPTPTVTAVTPTVEPTPTVVVITPTVEPTPTVAVKTPTSSPTPTTEPTPTVAVKTPTAEPTPTIEPTPTLAVNPCEGKSLPDFNSLKGKSLNDIQYYNQLLSMVGDYCAEGLVYKVQIGAYRKPQNYKYTNLRQFGKPEVIDYPDGITRFTQLQFTTLKAAEVQRQKSIAKGTTDAWIVAFVNGKRYTLEELIMLDYLGKAIN
jgi:tetratricopeptide (TPR) repeat protein